MRIEVRKKGLKQAVIITFHTKNFNSDYERSKFFRELHGWKQTVPRENKKYFYRRKGVLDEVPHVKIADSVFMVAMENMRRMMDFFDEWEDKVECDMMEILLSREKLRRLKL